MDKYDEMRRTFDESPYARLLGMKIEDLSEGYAKVSMRLSKEFLNWTGRAHGGLVASLADQASGCAMNSLGRTYFAVQFNIHYIASPQDGSRLVSEARAIHSGRTTGVCGISVYDDRGRIIAHATSTVVGIDRRS